MNSRAQKEFWNEEYSKPQHLTLSEEASEDLIKFTRWAERNIDPVGQITPLKPNRMVLDIGCGNGRNLIYLSQNYRMKGHGIDISEVAISQARKLSDGLPIVYEVGDISTKLPVADESVDFLLDMMTSHFLRNAERDALKKEILRVLKPGGWFFLKTFLADEDLHTERLLAEVPADEEGAYIHPRLGVYEYVWKEADLREFFGTDFIIHKVDRSHKHVMGGRAFKRRTISVYLERHWK